MLGALVNCDIGGVGAAAGGAGVQKSAAPVAAAEGAGAAAAAGAPKLANGFAEAAAGGGGVGCPKGLPIGIWCRGWAAAAEPAKKGLAAAAIPPCCIIGCGDAGIPPPDKKGLSGCPMGCCAGTPKRNGFAMLLAGNLNFNRDYYALGSKSSSEMSGEGSCAFLAASSASLLLLSSSARLSSSGSALTATEVSKGSGSSAMLCWISLLFLNVAVGSKSSSSTEISLLFSALLAAGTTLG